MINRREFFEITLGAGAALALTPQMLRALQQSGGTLIQRAIPSTGEMLPVVGTLVLEPPGVRGSAALKEVLKTFATRAAESSTRCTATRTAEQFHATVANELGIQNKVFWSTRGTPPAAPAARRSPGPAT
jgi:hypothetical protein